MAFDPFFQKALTFVNLVNGEKIMTLRNLRGWEQRELASRAQVDASVISRLERNLQDECKLSVLVAIAGAFAVSVDDLLNQHSQVAKPALVPEFEAIVAQLSRLSAGTQRQAAAILQGYLSTFPNE